MVFTQTKEVCHPLALVARRRNLSQLLEVMKQMNDVILGQELERNGLARPDSAFRLERILRKVRHNVRQIPVLAGPQRDQTGPGHLLNGLDTDAAFLIVAWKFQRVLQGGANEALMVVGRRVDQMPDHLLPRPAARTKGHGAIGFADLSKTRLG